MEITLFGILVVLIWCVSAIKGIHYSTYLTLCLIPFGTAAVINLPAVGGLSLVVASVSAAMTIGLYFLSHANILNRGEILLLRFQPASLILLLLSLYAVLSATLNVRYFQGDIMVFTGDRNISGSGGGIYGALVPLSPNTGNISQTFYFLLSCGFFFVVKEIKQIHGLSFLHNAICAMTGVHLLLALLDGLGLDGLLSVFRTANYAVLTDQSIYGINRVIGGYFEASVFGRMSVTFLAYFLIHFLSSSSLLSLCMTLALSVCGFMSASSTAFVGLFVTILIGAIYLFVRLSTSQVTKNFALITILTIAVTLSVLIPIYLFTPIGQTADSLLTNLIFEKAGSNSGQERSAWAMNGFHTFIDTFGLGAGVGSIRSNGWVSIYAGSVGLPGSLLFLAFLFLTFCRKIRPTHQTKERFIAQAAQASAFAYIVMKSLSAITLDPGILLMCLAAMCIQDNVQTNDAEPNINQPPSNGLKDFSI